MKIPHIGAATSVAILAVAFILARPAAKADAQGVPSSDGSTASFRNDGFSLFLPFTSPNTDLTVWYFDDFSDPQSGWFIYEDDVMANGYVENEYQLRVKANGGTSWSVPPGRLLQEYSAQIDVRVTEPGERSSYGLVYDLVDQSHFTSFSIDDYQRFSIQQFAGNDWQTLHDWQSSPAIRPNPAQNRLRIERRGEEYIAFINDEEVARGNTISQAGGVEVGVALWAYEQNVPVAVRFDNYEVRHLVD